MNPLTNMKNVKKLSEQELYTGNKTSWHDQYRDSAWIFVGGLPFDLTEGDIICIFSQYGEVVNVNLVRAKDTGKSRGFCFICYEDQRSTDLAVDNFNGIKVLNRTIRVDHVSEYKVPKEGKKTDAETKKLYEEGCAPKPVKLSELVKTPVNDIRETLADTIVDGVKLPPRLPIYTIKEEPGIEKVQVKKEKENVKKNRKKSKKRSRDSSSGSSSSSSSNNSSDESSSDSSSDGSSSDSSDSDDKNSKKQKKSEDTAKRKSSKLEDEIKKEKLDDFNDDREKYGKKKKYENRENDYKKRDYKTDDNAKYDRRNDGYSDRKYNKYDDKNPERLDKYNNKERERYDCKNKDDQRKFNRDHRDSKYSDYNVQKERDNSYRNKR